MVKCKICGCGASETDESAKWYGFDLCYDCFHDLLRAFAVHNKEQFIKFVKENQNWK